MGLRSFWNKMLVKFRDIDERISSNAFGRVFRLDGSGHPDTVQNARFWTEIRAGLTTFTTMAYIIAVNASVIGSTGGPCPATVCEGGRYSEACGFTAEYNACKTEVQRDLITATCAISGLATVFFGFFTNLPVALGPGMGMNAYFAFQVVGTNGNGKISYGQALTAVFVEGLIFMALTWLGIRQWLVRVLPSSIKIASGVGIGLFLTVIGLGPAAGIGLISGGGTASPLKIAGCPPQYIDGTSGMCLGHVMTSPTMWLGIATSGFLSAYLLAYRLKASVLIGIMICAFISWPRDTAFTFFPHNPVGEIRYAFFQRVAGFTPIKHTLLAHDWNVFQVKGHFALALFTFLYVDLIDCTATLYSMARFCGVVNEATCDFPRSTVAYSTDAFFISVGSLLGLAPITAFVESGSGIAQGGRTGLSAIVTGFCFLISLFFAPILASIPPWATGCTLVIVGCMMMRQVAAINWTYIGDALPSFVTIAGMPLMYSVAYGLIGGLFVCVVLNGSIHWTAVLSAGYIVPPDYGLKDYWSIELIDGSQIWLVRVWRALCRVNFKFWKLWRRQEEFSVLQLEPLPGRAGDREDDDHDDRNFRKDDRSDSDGDLDRFEKRNDGDSIHAMHMREEMRMPWDQDDFIPGPVSKDSIKDTSTFRHSNTSSVQGNATRASKATGKSGFKGKFNGGSSTESTKSKKSSVSREDRNAQKKDAKKKADHVSHSDDDESAWEDDSDEIDFAAAMNNPRFSLPKASTQKPKPTAANRVAGLFRYLGKKTVEETDDQPQFTVLSPAVNYNSYRAEGRSTVRSCGGGGSRASPLAGGSSQASSSRAATFESAGSGAFKFDRTFAREPERAKLKGKRL